MFWTQVLEDKRFTPLGGKYAKQDVKLGDECGIAGVCGNPLIVVKISDPDPMTGNKVSIVHACSNPDCKHHNG